MSWTGKWRRTWRSSPPNSHKTVRSFKARKALLERGLLRKSDTFFDYGCGHGMDVEALQNLGYQASGWDPAFRPNAPKTPAAVVNLGYVLNVIEEPSERIAALREAYSLAQRLLLVSTMVSGQENRRAFSPVSRWLSDKDEHVSEILRSRRTRGIHRRSLGTEVSTLGLGVCAVFRDQDEAEFLRPDATVDGLTGRKSVLSCDSRSLSARERRQCRSLRTP